MDKVAYKKSLNELAEISSGYPLRTSIDVLEGGNVSMIQVKNVDYNLGIAWKDVVKVKPTSAKIRFLAEGDILFAARNPNNFAIALKDIPFRTVCVPHFFIISLKDKSLLDSEFLAWQINQTPAQIYFKKYAGVSLVTNITREIVENLEITIPPMEKQKKVIEMHRTFIREKQVLKALIDNREQQMKAISQDIIL